MCWFISGTLKGSYCYELCNMTFTIAWESLHALALSMALFKSLLLPSTRSRLAEGDGEPWHMFLKIPLLIVIFWLSLSTGHSHSESSRLVRLLFWEAKLIITCYFHKLLSLIRKCKPRNGQEAGGFGIYRVAGFGWKLLCVCNPGGEHMLLCFEWMWYCSEWCVLKRSGTAQYF